MNPEHDVRLRLNLKAGELEVSGSERQVEQWVEKLIPLLSRELQKVAADGTPPTDDPRHAAAAALESHSQLPSTFGEYLHRFSESLSETDRMLVAASFLQQQSPENSFATAGANEILKLQGVKLANASECVRRNQAARRVFALAKGQFRLSESGWAYLKELQNGEH